MKFKRFGNYRVTAALFAILMAGLTLAACGGGGDTSGTTSGSSGETAATTSGGQGGESEPVKIMAMFPLSGFGGLYQPWANATKAAVEQLNHNGEANGRTFSLTLCDLGADANTALACGKKAVEEETDAVVTFEQTAAFEPLLKQANIPTFAAQVDPAMTTSPISFSIANLAATSTAALASLGKVEGCKKVAFILAFAGTAAFKTAYLEGFSNLAEELGDFGGTVTAPPEALDYTSFVTKAESEGADCYALEGQGPAAVNLINSAAETLPASAKLFSSTGLLTPEALESLSPEIRERLINTSYISPATEKANPSVKLWLEAIEKYSPSPKATDTNSAAVWAMVRAIAYASTQIEGEVSAEALLNQLNTEKDYNPGLTPEVSFDEPPAEAPAPREFQLYAAKVSINEDAEFAFSSSKPWFGIYTGTPFTEKVSGPDSLAVEGGK